MKFLKNLLRSKQEETKGEIFLSLEILIFSLYPVIVNYSSKIMPPLLYAGLCTLLAGIVIFFQMLFTGKLKTIFNKKAFKYIILVTIFIIIIPTPFIFYGTRMTTAVNTTIFMQSELLFAFILCALILKEKLTFKKIIGALAILIGATLVLYNGELKLNTGDLLIIIATIFFPLGNIYAKKALKLVPPSTIIFFRSIIGGITLMGISLIFERSYNQIFQLDLTKIKLILLNGILILGFSKILWYEALKRMDVSKATSLGMTYPGFSLIFAYLFLKEVPTLYQLSGLIIILCGSFLITRKSTPELIQQ